MELEKPKEKQNKEGISYIVSREAVDSSARLQYPSLLTQIILQFSTYNVLKASGKKCIHRTTRRFAFFSARSWEGEDSDDVEKEISRQASKAQSVKETEE
ncbi:hypothetical protein Bca52824_037852 [Brassica carinata]|uniref:Uncharacterized protein n=1 Tax=Brassica carinata TaxID=52824 RepID=A0A8X7RQ18_BRACI|nr:hypothetical protein Bca52824_037852 [Brassica carinata]